MPPSREDFERWRDDHVTRWVMRAHEAMAEECKLEWLGISWGNGIANQGALVELRTRADTYKALTDSTYEGYCEANGEEPVDE